ncbi:MAG: AsmA-like C-terminal region-containing protein [Verrucomicrobiales bacterium]
MKRVRLFLYLIAGVVVTGLGGLLGINAWVQSDQMRELLEDAATEATGMEVKMTKASYTPWGGLRVEGIQVPDVQQETAFFEAARLLIRPQLLPLIERRVELDEVLLEGPVVTWVQNEEGQFVLPLREKKAAKVREPGERPEPVADRPKKAPQEPLLISARAVLLKDGFITLRDRKGEALAEVENLNVTAALGATGEASGRAEAGEFRFAKMLRLSSVIAPFLYTDEAFEAAQFQAKLASGQVTGDFRVSQAEAGSPFRVKLEITESQLEEMLADMAAADDIAVTGLLFVDAEASGDLEDAASRRGRIDLRVEQGVVNQLGLLETLTKVLKLPELARVELTEAYAAVRIRGEEFRLDECLVQSDHLRVVAKGRVTAEQELKIKARLSLSPTLQGRLPREVARAFSSDNEVEGWKGLDFDVTGTLSRPRSNLQDRLVRGVLGNFLGN